MKAIPYVHFDGQCRAAFEFYAAVLRGEIGLIMTYRDAPVPVHLPDAAKDRIMHAVLVAGELRLMGSDMPPGMFEGAKGFSVSINPADPAEAERIHTALAEGGTVRMALQETFWAHRFGMLTDKFGTPWMVSCDK